MRFLVGVSSAFGAGALIGIGLGILLTEDKLRKEYLESTASYRRAMEMARKPAEAPVETEEELVFYNHNHDEPLMTTKQVSPDGLTVGVPMKDADKTTFKPKDVNPYHTAVETAQENNLEPLIEGGVHDYAIAYIDEEEYHEEDGRYKGQIIVLMDETNPIFFHEGVSITDWDERVGDSILLDLHKHGQRTGQPPVLYVRNHKTDEDYEVLTDQP